jgi:hypothetical protein
VLLNGELHSVGVAIPADGAAFDVGKEEGHRPRRQAPFGYRLRRRGVKSMLGHLPAVGGGTSVGKSPFPVLLSEGASACI